LAVLLPRPGAIDAAELAACQAVFRDLQAGALQGAMSAMGLAETIYALGRDRVPAEDRRDVERDLQSLLTIVSVDAALAAAAAEHRLVHYHRTRSPISYADSVAVVMAERAGVQLITVDAPLLGLGDTRVVPPSQLRLRRS
jgi:predicted nucleic acid-binding protein